jgi:hypothetical protein
VDAVGQHERIGLSQSQRCMIGTSIVVQPAKVCSDCHMRKKKQHHHEHGHAHGSSGSIYTPPKHVQRYNPFTKEWVILPSKMKKERFGAEAIYVKRYRGFIICSGCNINDNDACRYKPSIEFYSPKDDTFTLLTLQLPPARDGVDPSLPCSLIPPPVMTTAMAMAMAVDG